MKDKEKIRLFERLVLDNAIIFFDNKMYSKWDDQINWMEGYPRKFQKYLRDLFKKEEQSSGELTK